MKVSHWLILICRELKRGRKKKNTFRQPGLPFGLLWNCLPGIKWFGHEDIFWHFWKLTKIVNYLFKAFFGKKVMKISKMFKLLTNFDHKFGLFIFENLSFLRVLTAKFGLLISLTWQPCHQQLSNDFSFPPPPLLPLSFLALNSTQTCVTKF